MRTPLLCCLVFAVAGCDGMVALEGWAVTSANDKGGVVILSQRPREMPKDAIDSVTVEFWTVDGRQLLSRNNSTSGYFSLSYVGPYQPGLIYLVRASSPGYDPLTAQVQLERGTATWGRIDLRRSDTRRAFFRQTPTCEVAAARPDP